MSSAYQAQRARTALDAAGAARLKAAQKGHPREHAELQRTHDDWLNDIEPLADDFYEWPRYFKLLFWQILDELVAVCQGRSHDPALKGDLVSLSARASFPSRSPSAGPPSCPRESVMQPLTHLLRLQPTRTEIEHEMKGRYRVRTALLSPIPRLTLAHSRPPLTAQDYDHVLWLGHEIADAFAGSLSSPNHERRRRRAEEWYKRGILDRISKTEWDSQRSDSRMGVVACFDATRVGFRQGRNWATNERLGTAEDEPLVRLCL